MSSDTHDTRIASVLQEPDLPSPVSVDQPVFDPCHLGVALRALLFVETVLAVAALFFAPSFIDWLARLALLTGVALPATLAWLVTVCGLLQPLTRRGARVRVLGVLGLGLGGLAGLLGSALWGLMTGLLAMGQQPLWLAGAGAGALLAGVLQAWLLLRARGQMPADTTARLAELQARIRPHFLFNTLNSAMALVRAEPARAEALLEDLSDLFRHALTDHGAAVSLADEITLAQRYLAIEQVRFGERLRVSWALDPGANAARLPPLLLQPLLENAVRHGVEPSADGAQLRISTERRGPRVVLKIANTMPARPGPQGHGVALANVRARLALLHDLQGRFDCGPRDGVFLVRIEVPA